MRVISSRGEALRPPGRKTRAILAALCLARDKGVLRTRLYGQLWDRLEAERAYANFRLCFHELRAALGSYADQIIIADRESLRLDFSRCWIDALAIRHNVAAIDEADLSPSLGSRLLEGLDGLSGSFDQWLVDERKRFSSELRDLFEAELQRLSTSHAPPQDLVKAARRLLKLDPTNEMASRIAMLGLAQLGNRLQAIQEFDRCREALKIGLNSEPSRDTVAVYETIKEDASDTADRSAQTALQRRSGLILPTVQRLIARARQGRRRVRLGVRPFSLLSADVDDAVSVALAQELAAALSRLRWFDVFALNANRRLGAELDPQVDYVLDGALVANDERLRVSVQLLHVADGMRPVCGEHFELQKGPLGELLQHITAKTVGRFGPVLAFAEARRAADTDEDDSTALWLRAIPLMYSMERDKYEEAGRLLERAHASDPDNAMVAAWNAYWQVYYVGQGWTTDVNTAFEKAEDMSARAMRRDPENAEAQGIYGHICSFLHRDYDNALHYFERSLRLNPNSAIIWALSAATHCYVGIPGAAIERLDRYRDLAPFDPHFLFLEGIYSMAHAINEDYPRAAIVGRRVVGANPSFLNNYKHLIAALGHLGRHEEAARYVEKLLAIEPDFTVARFLEQYPLVRKEDRQRYAKGLVLAGIAKD